MLADQDPAAVRSCARSFGALADRCWELAQHVHSANEALCQVPGGWQGPAALAGSGRAACLAVGLERAADAAAEVAGILNVLAGALEEAASRWRQAAATLQPLGARLAADGQVLGAFAGDPGELRLVASAQEQAAGALAGAGAAAAQAAHDLTVVGERSAAVPALVGRGGAFAKEVETRLHGRVALLPDFAAGVRNGLGRMARGTLGAALVASPLYAATHPMAVAHYEEDQVQAGLFALRHPAAALRLGLGSDDLRNGHAARFWGQFAPELVLAVLTEGAGALAEGAGAADGAGALAEGAAAGGAGATARTAAQTAALP